MRKTVNNCVCCDLPCINCGRKHEEVFICDSCKEESNKLYLYENEEICEECLKENLISEFVLAVNIEEAIKNINALYGYNAITFKENSYYLDENFFVPYNWHDIISEIIQDIKSVYIDDMISYWNVDVIQIEN